MNNKMQNQKNSNKFNSNNASKTRLNDQLKQLRMFKQEANNLLREIEIEKNKVK